MPHNKIRIFDNKPQNSRKKIYTSNSENIGKSYDQIVQDTFLDLQPGRSR